MPVSSVWILEESNITISGGAVLDGVTQGDGSHLVGRTLTLNSPSWVETFVNDDDANFADNDGNQTLSGAQVIDGVTYVNGTRVEAEYTLTLTDPPPGRPIRSSVTTFTTPTRTLARSRGWPSSAPNRPGRRSARR